MPGSGGADDSEALIGMIAELAGFDEATIGRGGRGLFALKVSDDSMASYGISAGDWVVVRQRTEAAGGTLVAAMVDGAAVVREMGNFEDGAVPGVNAAVLGVAVYLIRRLGEG